MRTIFKRASALAAGAALAAATAVSTAVPAQAAATCDATFTRYATLRVGATGTQARAAECLLARAGYPTTVDGHFSAADGKALGAFRNTIGFGTGPVAGPKTWSALVAHGSTPSLRRGDRGADVLRLQGSLRAAKFTKVSITGTYDASTTTAVKAVQKARRLSQTGAVTASLWTQLQHGKVAAGQAAAKAKPKKSSSKSSSTKGAKALAFAKKQLGERYRYGAAGPNAWDCSGLTMKAWKAAGVKLPHNTRAQYAKGKKVSKKNLKKGDLVFFYSGLSHVAIYAGNGKVIHASRPGKPVAYIKMKYMPFKGARRPG